jgi:hypothetical protein
MQSLFHPKTILKLTALFCAIYLLSYLGYLFPILNAVIFWIILVGGVILSVKKLEYGVLLVLSELFLGGRGYLFSFNFFGFVVSLRLALFAMVFLIWFFYYHSFNKYSFAKSKYFLPFALLTFIFIIAAGRGVYFGHSLKNIFFDLNGYLYFALIFPAFDIVSQNFIYKLLKNLIAAGLALALLTIFMGFGFSFLHPEVRQGESGILSFQFEKKEGTAEDISHSVLAKEELKTYNLRRDMSEQKQAEYRWSRDTGVGELAYISGHFFRFFSSSQLYQVILLALILFFFKDKIFQKTLFKKDSIVPSVILAFIFLSIIISFSRSLWLGTVIIFLFFLFLLPKKYLFKTVAFGAIFLILLIIVLKFSAPFVYNSLSDRLASIFRPQTQSTALTRINILNSAWQEIKQRPILGSGFGKVITYESVIPDAAGTLKVFAFEWQYLEIILKMGFTGLLIYLWFLWCILVERYRLKNLLPENNLIASALIAGFVGFLIINLTTPYLNHPLGIGFLIIMMAMIENFKSQISKT